MSERTKQVLVQPEQSALVEALEGYVKWIETGLRGKDLHEKARAALDAAATHNGGWLPIEAAPRDAVILLGYAPHPQMEGSRRVYEGRWCEEQGAWTSVNGFLLHIDATHWMPLPAPPSTPC